MKITVIKMMMATEVLAAIIRENRPLPQKGSYRVARMHAKLLPEYNVAMAKRDEIIKSYGAHPKRFVAGTDDLPVEEENPDAFMVPAEQMADYTAKWQPIADEEIDLDVQPIPLDQLSLGDHVAGSITANEFITLGELVSE